MCCGIALTWLAALVPVKAAIVDDDACRKVDFRDASYTVCSFDPAKGRLRLFWKDTDGKPFRSFSALAKSLERDASTLTFAMNAGMYSEDFTPVGLYVEGGRELLPANTRSGPSNVRPKPNFYKLPNGVFYMGRGKARIVTTRNFLAARPKADYATQSGPMLVIDGALHPAFIAGSSDRSRRSGVGILKSGEVVFAISDEAVNFDDFAHLFRDDLGCRNALYLDGGRGTGLYSPALGRNDISWHGGFGPIFAVVQAR